MPKRKKPEEKPEEQFARFVKAAKCLGIDETGKVLDEAFARITSIAKSKKENKKT